MFLSGTAYAIVGVITAIAGAELGDLLITSSLAISFAGLALMFVSTMAD